MADQIETERAAREGAVLFFWPWSSDDLAAATLHQLISSTPPHVPVILPAGKRADRLAEAMADAPGRRLDPRGCMEAPGFASAMNQAARASRKQDLVVVADAFSPPGGWLRRLAAAAYVDDTVAAATVLASDPRDPLFPVLPDDAVLGAPQSPERGPRGAPASPSHPRVLSLRPCCSIIRHSAIELVGPFDEALTHPAAILADFAAKALAHGLSCVLADDIWMDQLSDGLLPCPEAELDVLARRHPWHVAGRREEAALEPGPLRRSLIAARTTRRPISVTIDARALGAGVGGTQTYVAALVLALAKSSQLAVRAVLAADAPSDIARAFADSGVEVASYEAAAAGLPLTDVVHRPQQVFTPADLQLLRMLGERVVISHLDLIAYRNPAYHPDPHAWHAYRRTTRLALAAADRVLFFSEHARDDAVAEDLIDPGRTALAGIGIDRLTHTSTVRRPERVPSGRQLILMLGADYLHKNRVFGLELVDQLQQRHGWMGLLVMAGGHVAHGSSSEAEAELLRSRPELASRVVDLGPVPDVEKRWLLANAGALLCPSTYEGFGLTPLEAAAAGTPCIYAACTSLGEVAGREAATIVPWDAAASADAAVALLREGEQRATHVGLLSKALERYDWDRIVDSLYRVYVDAVASPYRGSAPRSWEELEREELLVQLDAAHRDLNDRVAFGIPLIDRNGLLTRSQQRGLMRVASRRLSAPLLGPFGVIGRLGRTPRS